MGFEQASSRFGLICCEYIQLPARPNAVQRHNTRDSCFLTAVCRNLCDKVRELGMYLDSPLYSLFVATVCHRVLVAEVVSQKGFTLDNTLMYVCTCLQDLRV